MKLTMNHQLQLTMFYFVTLFPHKKSRFCTYQNKEFGHSQTLNFDFTSNEKHLDVQLRQGEIIIRIAYLKTS